MNTYLNLLVLLLLSCLAFKTLGQNYVPNDTIDYTKEIVEEDGKTVKVSTRSSITGLKQVFTLRKGRWVFRNIDGNVIKSTNYQVDKAAHNNLKHGLEFYFNQYGDTLLIQKYNNNILVDERPFHPSLVIDKNICYEIHKQFESLIVTTYSHSSRTKGSIVGEGGLNFRYVPTSYDTIEAKFYNPAYYNPPSFIATDSQNHIGNSRFEHHSLRGTFFSISNQVESWKPAVPSPDLYVSSAAYSGDACMGFRIFSLANDIEYIQNILVRPLQKDSVYCFSMQIRLAPWSKLATNKLSVAFSNEELTNLSATAPSNPNVIFNESVLASKNNWLTIQCTYRAIGGEQFATIGSFSDLDQMVLKQVPGTAYEAYYLIDNICLRPIQKYEECPCNMLRQEKEHIKAPPLVDEIEVWDTLTLAKGSNFVVPDVFFENDKAELLPESLTSLIKVSRFLKQSEIKIEVGGHTSDLGSEERNEELSLERAEAVKSFFILQGINSERITTQGYGPKMPIATNKTETGQALNRRVEIKIL